ncbi:MAG: flagellar hook-associated protein FlgK [Clostridium sp.]|nr:flagellar hook-associated protein FlgK [Clostridium sp.]MCM1398895.1 flagellar hook-associated protein FlgK [Clostridium sp.]MCM1458753.1 flagellar hook-associated protein FlgK [Bacteroides sp.]
MGGTMGRLSVGVTGLQTNQYALNTTAHNLMNTQTKGYGRQQVMLTDRTYNVVGRDGTIIQKAGLGVVTAELKHVRNNFADMAYRTESGRLDYYKAQYETVEEIEGYFGELQGQTFNDTLDAFWKALQEMQKETSSIVTRSSFIATAQTFLDRAQIIKNSLVTYQSNLNVEIEGHVSRINELAKEIYELNDKILAGEAANIENANDYRDARDLAIDELSSLVNTEIVTNKDATVEVFIEGKCLVTKGRIYELTTMRVSDNEVYKRDYDFTSDAVDFIMPVWADDESALFNIKKIPSAETESDIGVLKGLMMSRGYFVSNYTDVPVKPKRPVSEDFENDADYQAAMAQYMTDSDQYSKDLEYFNQLVEPYTITNLLAQFDVLVHGMVTGMNDVLCPNKEVELSDGTKIKILDEEAAGIGMGEGNEYAGTELFVRKNTPRYTKQTITLADGTTMEAQVYNEEDPDDYYSLYSVGNISVNIELTQDPSLLPLSRQSGEEAQVVADKLLDLWNSKFATVSPNSLVDCNFKDYYAGMMDDLSDRGYTNKSMMETQQQAVIDIDNYRQEVVGVSSDEELSNMIKFQHAYNAASRYINTVSEMIEHLINRLGA